MLAPAMSGTRITGTGMVWMAPSACSRVDAGALQSEIYGALRLSAMVVRMAGMVVPAMIPVAAACIVAHHA